MSMWEAKPETPGIYFTVIVNKPETLDVARVYPVSPSDAERGKGMRVARAGCAPALPCEDLPAELRYFGPLEAPLRFPVYREVEEEFAGVYEDDSFDF